MAHTDAGATLSSQTRSSQDSTSSSVFYVGSTDSEDSVTSQSSARPQADYIYRAMSSSRSLLDWQDSRRSMGLLTGSPPKAQEHNVSPTVLRKTQDMQREFVIKSSQDQLLKGTDPTSLTSLEALQQERLLGTKFLPIDLTSSASMPEESLNYSTGELDWNDPEIESYMSRCSGEMPEWVRQDLPTTPPSPRMYSSLASPILERSGGTTTSDSPLSSWTISTDGVNTPSSSESWIDTLSGWTSRGPRLGLTGHESTSLVTDTPAPGTSPSHGRRTRRYNDGSTPSTTARSQSSEASGPMRKVARAEK